MPTYRWEDVLKEVYGIPASQPRVDLTSKPWLVFEGVSEWDTAQGPAGNQHHPQPAANKLKVILTHYNIVDFWHVAEIAVNDAETQYRDWRKPATDSTPWVSPQSVLTAVSFANTARVIRGVQQSVANILTHLQAGNDQVEANETDFKGQAAAGFLHASRRVEHLLRNVNEYLGPASGEGPLADLYSNPGPTYENHAAHFIDQWTQLMNNLAGDWRVQPAGLINQLLWSIRYTAGGPSDALQVGANGSGGMVGAYDMNRISARDDGRLKSIVASLDTAEFIRNRLAPVTQVPGFAGETLAGNAQHGVIWSRLNEFVQSAWREYVRVVYDEPANRLITQLITGFTPWNRTLSRYEPPRSPGDTGLPDTPNLSDMGPGGGSGGLGDGGSGGGVGGVGGGGIGDGGIGDGGIGDGGIGGGGPGGLGDGGGGPGGLGDGGRPAGVGGLGSGGGIGTDPSLVAAGGGPGLLGDIGGGSGPPGSGPGDPWSADPGAHGPSGPGVVSSLNPLVTGPGLPYPNSITSGSPRALAVPRIGTDLPGMSDLPRRDRDAGVLDGGAPSQVSLPKGTQAAVLAGSDLGGGVLVGDQGGGAMTALPQVDTDGADGSTGTPGSATGSVPGSAPGIPFMPPMHPGAQPQGDKEERERQTWLTEDDDVWGWDDDCAPAVIGQAGPAGTEGAPVHQSAPNRPGPGSTTTTQRRAR